MSEHTTEIPEVRRLQRSRSDRMLAGVSGGLARYFHPAVFRVGFDKRRRSSTPDS